VQYISVPNTTDTKVLTLQGTASGSFTLGATEWYGETLMAQADYKSIPSGTGTIVTMEVTGAIGVVPLTIDYQGDGIVDGTVLPNEEVEEIEYDSDKEKDEDDDTDNDKGSKKQKKGKHRSKHSDDKHSTSHHGD